MPQRHWGLDQMLATLVEHRGHPKLRKAYRQFHRFAYQIMMTETHRQSGRWPKALMRKIGIKFSNFVVSRSLRNEITKRSKAYAKHLALVL